MLTGAFQNFFKVVVFAVFINGLISNSAGLSHSTSLIDKNVLIVRTVDGHLNGIDVSNGKLLWIHKDNPTVSQNISNIVSRQEEYQSEIAEEALLDVVSISPDELLSSDFLIDSDAIISGGRFTTFYSLDPLNGTLLYTCSSDGCTSLLNATNPDETPEHQIMIKQLHCEFNGANPVTHLVQWSYRVLSDDVSVLWKNVHDKSSKATDTSKFDGGELDLEFIFNIETGVVCASLLSDNPLEYWRTTLHSPIVKAWLYRSSVHEIEPVSVLRRDLMNALTLIEGPFNERKRAGKDTVHAFGTTALQIQMPPKNKESQLVYLGNHNGQLYIQSDGPISPQSFLKAQLLSVYNSPNEYGRSPHKSSSYLRGFYWTAETVQSLPKTTPNLLEASLSPSHTGNPAQCATDAKDRPAVNQNTYQEIFITMAQTRYSDADSFVQIQRAVVGYHILTWSPQILALLVLVMTLVQLIWCSRLRGHYKVPTPLKPLKDPSPASSSTEINSMIPTELVPSEFSSTFENDFKFIDLIGSGAFGRVFEVENRFDGHRYAIKRIRLRGGHDDLKKYLREVTTMADLDHPGIARYHRAWIEYPPDGWQETRDLFLLKDFDDEDEDEDNDDTQLLNSLSTKSRFSSNTDATHIQSREDCSCVMERHLPPMLKFLSRSMRNSLCGPQPICSISFRGTCRKLLDDGSVTPTSDWPGAGAPLSPSPSDCFMYIQMQLYSRDSLHDWLLAHRTLDSRNPRGLSLFRQIVNAVAYLHAAGYIHRDLKPSNILLDARENIKLADFGLVTTTYSSTSCIAVGGSNDDDECFVIPVDNNRVEKEEEDDLISFLPKEGTDAGQSWSSSDVFEPMSSSDGASESDFSRQLQEEGHTTQVGTDLYMSPEQATSRNYDEKVDIFSLGLIFFEMTSIFTTEMERIGALTAARSQKLPDAYLATYPEQWKLCLQMLSRCPKNRPSANEVESHSLFAL